MNENNECSYQGPVVQRADTPIACVAGGFGRAGLKERNGAEAAEKPPARKLGIFLIFPSTEGRENRIG